MRFARVRLNIFQAAEGVPMKIRGIDFIMYPVSNLARAATFYGKMLGLQQTTYSEEWHWAEFDCGGLTLALNGGEKLPEVPSGARVALAVEDIQAAHEELKKQGVEILSPPRVYSVCQAMEILDPDGNLLILHQRADGSFG